MSKNLKPVGDDSGENEEIRKQIQERVARGDDENWELSVLLHAAYDKAMYAGWGYSSWKEYVEKELDFKQRKAEYMLAVGKWHASLPATAKKWARKLSFSKARLIVGVVTPENIAEWKSRIDGKSFREIEDIVKGSRDHDDGDEDPEEGSGGADQNKAKSLNFKLFPAQMENVKQALEIAKGMAESDKPGHALDLICTDFLSTNGGIETVQDYLTKVEKATGVRLVGYDSTEDAVIFGGKLIDELRRKKSA